MNDITTLNMLVSGVSITIVLMLSALGIGLNLAIAMVVARVWEQPLLNKLIDGVVFCVCGTPLLVQLFLIYFGLGQFALIRESLAWTVLRDPMGCAIIALAINTACYTYVLLQGALRSVPQNEVAACDALGMSKWLALRRILLPRAFRIALPAYSNEVIMILKSTSLASTITLLDLMGVTQALIAQSYAMTTYYVIAGACYLALNVIVMGVFYVLQRYYAVPTRES